MIELTTTVAKDKDGNNYDKKVTLYKGGPENRYIISFGWPCEYYLETLIKNYPYQKDLVIDAIGRNHKGTEDVKIDKDELNRILEKAVNCLDEEKN